MQEDRIAAVYDGETGNPAAQGYGMGWWITRGQSMVSDAGAYGSMPWIDQARGYAAMIIVETRVTGT